ncbi:ATP-dependent zinc metalloprotease FtsH [Alteracholeplasma palmae J233]|uniref:ATP-dependent zinc metalloprotease FtsH n=1 Tax=Alteracholeplasma palmae (strain ATCC 49389 / J233) TaxID=1318466 RepID=U4KLU6_ALTPJ|nr:ATP-dependent zinc metalloprotease FtsH [Alteracholeplasma palmae]CCV64974.1 ATP-dependent zinc metalloprotease FtsH [Alteracholeplasma palmae J233]
MNQKPKKPTTRKNDILALFIVLLVAIGLFYFIGNLNSSKTESIRYQDFLTHITNEEVKSATATPVGGDNTNLIRINGELKEGATTDASYSKYTKFTLIISQNNFEAIQDKPGASNIVYVAKSGFSIWSVVISLLPLAASILLFVIIFRSMSGANNKAMDFGKNRAKLSREKTVTFKDVAGADEEKQEMAELVDFLKNPRKYVEIGARIPKGVLLSGSPGTGKTLLAKAVAGEASVPFFTISGSDFVELYVGVGASRVRDLFRVAKENAPCIIFIDEIDAVGRQRGAGLGGGNDEREQTLNQLLVEMDGFTTNQGIIIIAATNRPDVLDPAILRPGRFDRQITINLPDAKARAQILEVHARNKKLNNVNFKEVASRTPGFSGADLENLLNEAALLAARDNRAVINPTDIDEAIDRVMMGPAKKSKKYNENERRMVAYHEAGHAVIGIKLKDANIVQKITIIPRGRAGGYNLMMPEVETFFSTKKSLLAQITSFLGGRVAEELKFDTVTNGAYNDFQNATAIARAMVTEYGMSDLGPIQYENNGGNVFLGRDYLKDKNFSDQVALEIDKEVRKIITTCYDQAKEIISTNQDLLENITKYLLAIETLNKSDIDEIVNTGKLAWFDKEESEEQPSETTTEVVDAEVVTDSEDKNPNHEA